MIICNFSDQHNYRIIADGREYLFDFSEQFGPWVQRLDGRGEAKNQPNPEAKFWKAVTFWRRQGKRVGKDGLCIWEYPPKELWYRLDRRNLLSESMYIKLRSEGKVPELEPITLES